MGVILVRFIIEFSARKNKFHRTLTSNFTFCLFCSSFCIFFLRMVETVRFCMQHILNYCWKGNKKSFVLTFVYWIPCLIPIEFLCFRLYLVVVITSIYTIWNVWIFKNPQESSKNEKIMGYSKKTIINILFQGILHSLLILFNNLLKY